MRIPKKGELSKKLYRKEYTGYLCHMSDRPLYTLVEAKEQDSSVPRCDCEKNKIGNRSALNSAWLKAGTLEFEIERLKGLLADAIRRS